MCNAYNHPPGCTCGWGGGVKYTNYYTNKKKINPIPKVFPVESIIIGRNIEKFVILENDIAIKEKVLFSETKPVNCNFWGMKVYYYKNNIGSKVFFEHLGIPWIKHECKEYLKFKNNKK